MLSYVLSLAAGSLTSLSPCVLPVLPLIVGSAAQQHRLAPAAMAIGMTASFTVVGALLAGLGHVLGLDQGVLRMAGAVLMLLMGMFLLIRPLQEWFARVLAPLASRAQSASGGQNAKGLGGQFLSGALLGAVWSPCVGPTLGAAVGLASQAGGITKAFLMMLFFGVGATIPLLMIAYGLRSVFFRRRKQLLQAGELGKKILGVSLAVIAVLVLTGTDKALEAAMIRVLPDWWISLTTRF